MKILEPGMVINTTKSPITIDRYLAKSSRGEVFIVEYEGKKKILKWYNSNAFPNFDAFYCNLKHIAENGSPSNVFVWVDAVTEKNEGSFGIVMDIIPKGYYPFSKVVFGGEHGFSSFKKAIHACIGITHSFRMLHQYGYTYADISDGMFFINPETGDVLVCDNENIVPVGTTVNIMQPHRYSAPETVVSRGERITDIQSERYALSVFIFMTLFGCHPLEGKRWLVPFLHEEIAKVLYGTNPVFIFDPDNNSNPPIEHVHKNAVAVWNAMPDFMKEMFIKAFSNSALLNPCNRIREPEWLNALTRFSCDVVRCSCGSEIFVDGIGEYKCDCCDKTLEVKSKIELPTYSVAAISGVCIYKRQIKGQIDENFDKALLVVKNSEGMLGVKNMTSETLMVITPKMNERALNPGEIMPFLSGASIKIFDKVVKLI